jgi:cell division protein ZapB
VFAGFRSNHDAWARQNGIAAVLSTATLVDTQPFSLTDVSARNYSFAMAEAKTNGVVELELKRLEKRVDELLATVQQIKEENRALRQRQETLAAEKTSLLNRNEQVRTRVEAMIGRLKAMEHSA